MDGVLQGFSTVFVIVALGAVSALALPSRAAVMQHGLTAVTFYVTNPVLMVVVVSQSDLHEVLARHTPIAIATAATCAGLFAVVARYVLRADAEHVAAASMASVYVNAGNIGIPISVYVVGSTSPVVSVLFTQQLVLAPSFIVLFAWVRRRRDPAAATPRPWRAAALSVVTPMFVGTILGVVLAAVGTTPPDLVWEPLTMVGGAAIPMMLLVFGMGLVAERPFAGGGPALVLWAGVVKVLVMPLVAWLLAGVVLGIDGADLLGIVVMAALPSAQLAYLFARQFGVPSAGVRDIVVSTSIAAFPVILGVTAVLGR